MEGKGTVGQGRERESRKEGTERLRGPGIWCFSQASDWWWQWLQAACVWDLGGLDRADEQHTVGTLGTSGSPQYKFRIGGTWRRCTVLATRCKYRRRVSAVRAVLGLVP